MLGSIVWFAFWFILSLIIDIAFFPYSGNDGVHFFILSLFVNMPGTCILIGIDAKKLKSSDRKIRAEEWEKIKKIGVFWAIFWFISSIFIAEMVGGGMEEQVFLVFTAFVTIPGTVFIILIGHLSLGKGLKEIEEPTNLAYETSAATGEKVADIPMTEKAADSTLIADSGAERTEVAARLDQERAVFASSAVSYQGTVILYKVKVENKLPKPISDIKLKAFVPDVFLIKEDEKTIAMLEPNNARTVSFEIRPTGECGDCNISGRVTYYNHLIDKREEIEIPVKSVSIICPLLKAREISEEAWRTLVSSMVEAGENTKEEIPISAKSLFNMVADIVKDLNLYMVGKSVTDDGSFFRSVARFYGEGVKDLKYAAQIEVIGGQKKSQLILKSWAEREDALTGFYYKILDEIEKRVKIKDYIDDSIVQQYYHIGDKIGAVVKDSVVQRSTLGAGEGKE